MKKNKISKAVFPVAGLGTRFLPATKASPKEMLPIVDKPLIQYAVEEAIDAGITEMIFITGRSKRAIEDHFDKAYELENELALKHKTEILQTVQQILPPNVHCIYIRQQETLGLGHAVLCAKSVIGDDDFAVLLADDLLDNQQSDKKPVLTQMCDVYEKFNCSILGVQNVPLAQTSSYGIAATAGLFKDLESSERIEKITALIEKPKPANAPSTLAVVGRYVLSNTIFEHLEKIKPGSGGEIQLTDAIASLLNEENVLAYRYEGTRYDCGSKLGYLQASVIFGQRHPEVGEQFRKWIGELNK